jgi:polyisoprenyl-phosphate glycosyltransferase
MTESDESTNESELELVVVTPVYNDWEAAECFLRLLDNELAKSALRPIIVIVNDGSTTSAPDDFLAWSPKAFAATEILDLYSNLGHQRAICVAMVHVCDKFPAAAVLVMDADGEDPPEQVGALVRSYLENRQQTVVFAARRKRMEGPLFKTLYQTYRLAHFVLVGFDIRIGNFSIIPQHIVARLVRSSDLWNHYAACVVKSRLPYRTIPLDRGNRLKGRSNMALTGLILHGLSAISVYSDIVGVRILMSALALLAFAILALFAVVGVRFYTHWAIPGWATTAFMLVLLLIAQLATLCLLFTFGILAARNGPAFIPIRDCPHFVMNVRRLQFDHA